MKQLAGILTVIFCISNTYAATPTDLMTDALAKVEGVETEYFEPVSIKPNTKGFELSYTREQGEGGDEVCQGQYRNNGTLATLDCNVDYTSHSMGPENKHFLTNIIRSFDESGKLVKVEGHTKAVRLKDKKVVENREIESTTDEKISELTKPVLKLSPELIKQMGH